MIIAATFLQAIIFQVYSQIAKRLREKGLSGLHVLYYQRLALYPSLVALVFFWNQGDVQYMINHWNVLAMFVGFILCQTLFQYIYFVSRHMARSLTFVDTILDAVALPLSLIGGFLINNNIPSAYQIIAIILLIFAVFIKPSSYDKEAGQRQSLYALSALMGIIISYMVLQFVKDPLYRQFLTNIPHLWFGVALFLVCATLLTNIFFLIRPLADADKAKRVGVQKLAYAIPTLWFIASLPEGYSFARLPVYTIVAIGTVTLLMSLASDLYNNRVRFDIRTAVFSTLALSGIIITVLAR